MASTSSPIFEGVLAVNKPAAISSAQVIRDLQQHFNPSSLFSPWMQRENARRDAESHNQKRKRRSWKQRQPLNVKIGHGGTLDPLATGVLILGVGSGTKRLNHFLDCTKSYEAVVLFGAATDTYDTEGKVVARKSHAHITQEKVLAALAQFRGKIMQRPPIFSALRVQGKRLYEYAREGKEVPVEIQERPVEVEALEMLDWMPGGTHEWQWPEREAEPEEKQVVDHVLHLTDGGNDLPDPGEDLETSTAAKRKRVEDATPDISTDIDGAPASKVPKPDSRPSALPVDLQEPSRPTSSADHLSTPSQIRAPCPAPAARLRMTVTSGFYVRSLCHDLGAAVDSLAIMASLVRTRQGDFELGTNVLEYEDLRQGETHWGPKVQGMLQAWEDKEKDDEASGDKTSAKNAGPAEDVRTDSAADHVAS